MAENNTTAGAGTPANTDRNITDSVLSRINTFQAAGELRLPNDYSPENALKSAWLILQETKTRDGKPVLVACTRESIANTLLDMVVQGLSPVKKQCYFIPYADKLTLSRSYAGTISVAKRDGGVKSVVANCIYEGDDFIFEIDGETGLRRILKHTQSLENLDPAKMKGAYAILELEDGRRFIEVMNVVQIKKAWLQGAAKGNSGAHQNFGDEMAKKTVINRACKLFINSSDDSNLSNDDDDVAKQTKDEAISSHGNKMELSIESEEVAENTKVEEAVVVETARHQERVSEQTPVGGSNGGPQNRQIQF